MSSKGVVISADYAFNAAARTVTFSAGYTGMALSDVLYITNVKSGVAVIIYDPSNSLKGGTLSGLILTLAFDTTAMSNGDPLQIIIGLSSLAIPVSGTVTVDTSLLATSAKQDTGNTSLASIDTKLTNPLPVSASSLPLPTGGSTSALQTTGNTSLASIDTKLTNPLPISAASLPLPTGAATESTLATLNSKVTAVNTGAVVVSSSALPTGASTASLQTQPGVDIGDVTVNNASGASAVNIQDGGNSITVDGTFFQTTQPISAAALPLPSGAATSANQSTEISSLASIDTKVTNVSNLDVALSTRTKPSDQQHAIVDSSALPTGAATSAKQDSQTTLLTNIDAGIPAALGQTTMAASMPVTLASDQSAIVVSVGATDNTQLYSATISATGAIAGINTTGYQSIIIQLTGTWSGNLIIEGSNDDSNYNTVLVLNCNELIMQDVITGTGNYQLKTTTKFARLNVKQLQSGTIPALVVGRTVPGLNASDILSLAMTDPTNALFVQETGTKKDLSKALIPSDAPPPIYGFAQATSSVIFNVDTTGYQSVSVQCLTFGSSITVQASNDGVTWVSAVGYNTGQTQSTATISTAGIWEYPTVGKFIRGVTIGANFTNVLVYLRQRPANPFNVGGGATVNIQGIGGNLPVTSGVVGLLAVGGNVANGVAPTANPNMVAGIDTTGLTRRILTDTNGRIINAGTDQLNTTRPIGVLSPGSNSYGIASQLVTEASVYEGMSMIEIMAQILIELRVNNAMMNELPQVLNRDNGMFDDLIIYKNDFGNINQ